MYVQTQSTVKQVLTDKSIRLALIIGIALHCLQQFSGINAVFYYSSDFFKSAGVENDWLGTVLIGSVNVIATAGVYLYV